MLRGGTKILLNHARSVIRDTRVLHVCHFCNASRLGQSSSIASAIATAPQPGLGPGIEWGSFASRVRPRPSKNKSESRTEGGTRYRLGQGFRSNAMCKRRPANLPVITDAKFMAVTSSRRQEGSRGKYGGTRSSIRRRYPWQHLY